MSWLVLAMAHHRLGQPEQARAWMARADRWLDEEAADPSRAAIRFPPPMDSWDWVEAIVLYREATSLGVDGGSQRRAEMMARLGL